MRLSGRGPASSLGWLVPWTYGPERRPRLTVGTEANRAEEPVTNALRGRTALVTGAGRGLGEAIARGLHAGGARVALADIDEEAVRLLATGLGGRDVIAVSVDVRSKESFGSALQTTADEFGQVDVLVNNAAITLSRPVWEIDQEEWDDVLAVNLRSVLFGCQLAGAVMRTNGWGRIINLSSLAGQQGGLIAGAHYAASKAGILVLTKIFAQELAPFGVTVNALAPAAIRGQMMDAMPQEKVETLASSIPVGRVGQPEEVAAAAVYLASDAAGYVTGATLDINGGRFMR